MKTLRQDFDGKDLYYIRMNSQISNITKIRNQQFPIKDKKVQDVYHLGSLSSHLAAFSPARLLSTHGAAVEERTARHHEHQCDCHENQ